MTRRLAALLFAVGLATACGTTTASSTAPLACHVNADCTSGNSCQFAVYGSCGVPGACVPNVDGAACVPQTACGCDGATHAVCLVNGNATAPIASLGSCDGATQQGFDASTGVVDASPGGTDAADAQVTPPDDSGSIVDTDSSPDVDAADATPASTLGTPCTSSTQCTDPVFNSCHFVGGVEICTKHCSIDTDCQPPASATCNTSGATSYCQP